MEGWHRELSRDAEEGVPHQRREYTSQILGKSEVFREEVTFELGPEGRGWLSGSSPLS